MPSELKHLKDVTKKRWKENIKEKEEEKNRTRSRLKNDEKLIQYMPPSFFGESVCVCVYLS